jgi:hypothetical protein
MDVRSTRSDKPTTAAPALKTTEGLENRRRIISRKGPTPDMGLRSGTAIIFCINAKDDELCEAVPLR